MANLSVEVAGIRFPNPIMPAAGPPVRDGRAIVRCAAGGAGGLVSKTVSRHAATPPDAQHGRDPARPRHGQHRALVRAPAGAVDRAGVRHRARARAAAHRQPRVQRRRHRLAGAADQAVRGRGRALDPLHRRGRRARWSPRSAPRRRRSTCRSSSSSARSDARWSGGRAGRRGRRGRDRRDQLVRSGARHRPGHAACRTSGGSDGYGWLSGPALKPLAIRCVRDIARAVPVPVIGVGGVSHGIDAVEMLMAGASAVQVCTAAILHGPGVFGRIARELDAWLDEHGYASADEIRGLALGAMPAAWTGGKPVVVRGSVQRLRPVRDVLPVRRHRHGRQARGHRPRGVRAMRPVRDPLPAWRHRVGPRGAGRLSHGRVRSSGEVWPLPDIEEDPANAACGRRRHPDAGAGERDRLASGELPGPRRRPGTMPSSISSVPSSRRTASVVSGRSRPPLGGREVPCTQANGALVESSQRVGGLSGDHVVAADPATYRPGRRRRWPWPGRRSATARLTGTWLYAGNWMNHFGHFVTETLTTLWPDQLEVVGLVSHPFIFEDGESDWQLELLELAGLGRSPGSTPALACAWTGFMSTRPFVPNGYATPAAVRVWRRVAAAARRRPRRHSPDQRSSCHERTGIAARGTSADPRRASCTTRSPSIA